MDQLQDQSHNGGAAGAMMGFWQHFEELKARLLRCLGVFLGGFLLCYFVTDRYVFEFLQKENGCLWCDLLNVHPGIPNLQMLLHTYSRYHTHTASEPLYVLAGEMIFGFVKPDGSRLQLLVQPQDYISIPVGVEHWCSLSASLNFKAVRYFTSVEGWVPNYTGTQLSDCLNNPC